MQEQVRDSTGVRIITPRRLIVVSVRIPITMLYSLDELVALNKYKNRSHAIRAGIRLLLLKENNTEINS
jgi:metal-responsive CopG/Arc/MetJ family transcriptional regulator